MRKRKEDGKLFTNNSEKTLSRISGDSLLPRQRMNDGFPRRNQRRKREKDVSQTNFRLFIHEFAEADIYESADLVRREAAEFLRREIERIVRRAEIGIVR